MTKEQINKRAQEWLNANHLRREDLQTAWFVPIGFVNRLIERVDELEKPEPPKFGNGVI